ncbi:MAG: sugar phosphate nucleotidyltransferase [Candidatus Peregrinibacteria bacterium]|nr:sugar phosphate nucleotidyltransferase [Candidatus Peregrinibacteria bacterium]MDZ4244330.1 sugar phosphate nucleotidyltransferase [Candidatus Gracilibacteria bacterium]
MKVILLAAGQSKRVSPIEDKNFVTFCGKYLIEWQLANLIELGMDDFVIVGNEGNLGKLKEFVGEFKEYFKDSGFSMEVVEQKKVADGMAGGVVACKEYFEDEPCLIVSCNDVVDLEAYESVLEVANGFVDEQGLALSGALLGYKVEEYFPGGYMKFGHANRVEGIVEKPGAGKQPSDYVNIVVHLHSNYDVLYKALCEVKSLKDDKYEVALDNMIKAGGNFQMVPYEGFWQPLKFPWHITELDKHFFKRRAEEIDGDGNYKVVGEALVHMSAEISDKATIKGDVIIEAGVKVFENAVIQGPAYLEEGCVVGNNALFRESFAGQRCVIGFSTEVARSHLSDDVWTHSNYIGDSIIGSNVSFGAGAITANLRLDEGDISWQGEMSGQNKLGLITGDHVRVGVQTCLMPGISIGKNVMVGSGLTISESIEANEFIYGKTSIHKKKNKTDVSGLLRD